MWIDFNILSMLYTTVWLSGNGLVNLVDLHWAWLVLGRITICWLVDRLHLGM